jgi:soluble lytic murein transglycosylase-like protein
LSLDSWLRRLTAVIYDRRLSRLATLALWAGAALVASPASAQVMDISQDGTVTVRRGSGAATFEPETSSSSSGAVSTWGPAVPSRAITMMNQALIPVQYADAVEFAASSANISPTLLAALIWQESRWNARAVSRKGAMGLTQLMPGTARQLGVNPADPAANLVGGARYLRQLLDQFDGNVEKALAAYNAGPGRVRSAGGIPAIAETQNYVASIVRRVANTTTGGQE